MRYALAGLALSLPLLSQTVVDGGLWTYSAGAANFVPITIAALEDGTTSAIRATTLTATPSTPYNTQASRVLPPAFSKGRWLRFRLWARSDTTQIAVRARQRRAWAGIRGSGRLGSGPANAPTAIAPK